MDDLGANGQPIKEGQQSVSERRFGSSVLRTVCTISNITKDGAPSDQTFAYQTGSWNGDSLHALYDVSKDNPSQKGMAIVNRSPNGTPNDGTTKFRLDCDSTLNGKPVDLRGIVYADGEQNNWNPSPAVRQRESISMRPINADGSSDPSVHWRLLETRSECERQTLALHDAATGKLTLRTDGIQCPQRLGGPIAVLFGEGATRGEFELLAIGGAASAAAVGVVLPIDFGDAPLSYDQAGSIYQPKWSGGDLTGAETRTREVPLATNTTDRTLGKTIDAEPRNNPSSDARGDGNSSVEKVADDEDALFTYTDPDRADTAVIDSPTLTANTQVGQTFSTAVSCEGTGKVQGWLDWARDGSFTGDGSSAGTCEDGKATIEWTVPANAKTGNSFLRLRIAGLDEPDLQPTGLTLNGEVEDHPVTINLPGFDTKKSAHISSGSSSVSPGEHIEYTLEGVNTGNRPLSVKLTDTMAAVSDWESLDNDSLVATIDGAEVTKLVVSGNVLTWQGADLPVGKSVVVKYRVTVKREANGKTIDNVLAGTGTPHGGTPIVPVDKKTSHPVAVPGFEVSKTADPENGTTVAAGDVVTYTVTGKNTGGTVLDPVVLTDDLAEVLEYSDFFGPRYSARVDGLQVPGLVLEGTKLTWTGRLAIGQTVTVTYAVKVKDGVYDTVLRNRLTGSATPPGGTPPIVPPAVTVENPIPPKPLLPGLPVTGTQGAVGLTVVAGLLLGAGAYLLRRRRIA